jgi:hypothetical protein
MQPYQFNVDPKNSKVFVLEHWNWSILVKNYGVVVYYSKSENYELSYLSALAAATADLENNRIVCEDIDIRVWKEIEQDGHFISIL